jgi:hypothetical protein
MGKAHILAFVALSVAVPGCAGSNESSQRPDELGVLERARAKARSAPYLVVVGPLGQRLERTPRLTVIWEGGRVRLWARRDVEYTLRRGGECYERHTDFSHGDIAEVRRNTVVPYDVDDATVHMAGGRTLVRWRVRQEGDTPGNEGQLVLHRGGRPAVSQERTMRWGARPASRWLVRRYRYPSRLSVPPPRPPCRERSSTGESARPTRG